MVAPAHFGVNETAGREVAPIGSRDPVLVPPWAWGSAWSMGWVAVESAEGVEAESGEIRADVCVVGAGIAGLNALWVASQYLRPDQTAVLVDRNDRPGGMWVATYDYVRLHQPHPFFTTGNVPWTIDKPPEYLADKGEVLDHLQHCLDEIREKITVVELFGHELESHDEVGDAVQVVCRGAGGQRVTVVADRLVKAVGLSVETNPALVLSSDAVRSVSPDFCDVRDGEIAQDSAPVWIVEAARPPWTRRWRRSPHSPPAA